MKGDLDAKRHADGLFNVSLDDQITEFLDPLDVGGKMIIGKKDVVCGKRFKLRNHRLR